MWNDHLHMLKGGRHVDIIVILRADTRPRSDMVAHYAGTVSSSDIFCATGVYLQRLKYAGVSPCPPLLVA